MTLWVKICGLTSEDAVEAAATAGADAIGFVFAPSKRQVSAARAAQLAARAPAHIARVAVMQHPTQSLLDDVWNELRPDVLQTDVEDLSMLELPEQLAVIPVVRAAGRMPTPLPQRVLFEGPVSGAGKTADWAVAAQLGQRTQVILAGGLNPTNVADAIAQVHPFGVDVSSGVEREPGIKDPQKIIAFVKAARSG